MEFVLAQSRKNLAESFNVSVVRRRAVFLAVNEYRDQQAFAGSVENQSHGEIRQVLPELREV